jgi:hypothetical protein
MHPAKPSIATWLILLLGVFMVVTPWIFGFTGLEVINAVADGIAIVLVSLLAVTTYRRLTGGWVSFVLLSMVLGMESIVGSQLLAFTGWAMPVLVSIGVLVIALAMVEMWRLTSPTTLLA